MRCMLLVKSNEKVEADGKADERVIAEVGQFNEEMLKAGVMLAGEGLCPSSKGARVRLANGKFTVTQGPFASAKQLIAGYWTLKTQSKEEAVTWLERVPPSVGNVELWPLYETEDFPVDPAEQTGGWRDQELETRDAYAAAPPKRLPGTKRFILMLQSDALTESGAPPSEEILSKMGELMEEGVTSGAMLGGDGLKPSSLAVRLSSAGGKRSRIDGPFAETKELIAGYVLLQLPSLNEAIGFAKRWLEIHMLGGPPESEIEIRELMEFES